MVGLLEWTPGALVPLLLLGRQGVHDASVGQRDAAHSALPVLGLAFGRGQVGEVAFGHGRASGRDSHAAVVVPKCASHVGYGSTALARASLICDDDDRAGEKGGCSRHRSGSTWGSFSNCL